MSLGISLFCGFTVPVDSLCIIFGYTFTIFITYSEVVLSLGISLFCGFTVPVDSLCIIFGYTFTIIIT